MTPVVVSGTGTGVGKTWLACRLIESLRSKGVAVAARKPAQSFDPDEGSTDADLLAAASGEKASEVCPPHRSHPIPMAPPIAARVLGMPAFTIADLVAELHLPGEGIVMVEGAGGPRSPLASDGDTVALAAAIDSPLVVLVADPELGTINATLLAASAFAPQRVVVFFNRYEDSRLLHRTNLQWLRAEGGLEVYTFLGFLSGLVAGLDPAPQEAPA